MLLNLRWQSFKMLARPQCWSAVTNIVNKNALLHMDILMKEWGIERPEEEPVADIRIDWFKFLIDHQGEGRRGASSLHKWECPECGIKVRIGIKGNPEIIHDPCSIKKGGEDVFY
jgi:hypothetical protein